MCSASRIITTSLIGTVFFFAFVSRQTARADDFVTIPANKTVLDEVSTWDQGIACYANKASPITSLEGLKEGDLAFWGGELVRKGLALQRAIGITSASVRTTNAIPFAPGAGSKLKLFCTWRMFETRSPYPDGESMLGNAIRVVFSSAQ
jgi:hypothetical protein